MKTPVPAPDTFELWDAVITEQPDRLAALLARPMDDSAYMAWDKLMRSTPPEGLDHRTWWLALRIARRQRARELPLRQKDGSAFTYVLTDRILEACEDIARRAGGQIQLSQAALDLGSRDSYIFHSLVEESITSSQLEGASTSRRVAKEMLETQREPRDRSERMILNNFEAMEFVRSLRDEELTPELVLEIHRVVTESVLDDPADAGRLEQPGGDRVQVFGHDDQVLHRPPAAEELPERLQALCDFANGQHAAYLSPVVKAVTIHFMVGYDHYFADGNGRTARALFYWSMLRSGYWLVEHLTISKILKGAPSQYAFSYLLTEDDGGDPTHFLHYQLGVIQRALDEMTAYLQRKTDELESMRQTVGSASELSPRQARFLEAAADDPAHLVTVKQYAERFRVSDETARTDLNQLTDQGLLVKRKVGKAFRWGPAEDLADRLRG
ncbi:Fic family protein [Kocuria palustris]|uniref:Fic family protein n=1 Tax=Kocuria palustris TaxID=71999 RepID=UPI00246897F2|nr:Fic family protein [Kocuria palustris]MDH5150998.1 Fic family protein [Kocuria palustris]